MVIEIQFIIVFTIVLTIIIVFIFLLYRAFINKILQEKNIQHELALNHQKEIALQASLVQENERKRIAEVLHDDVGNKLNILSLWINNEDTWNDERSKGIIVQQIPELIETTRNISHSLYPVNLEKFGLILTIEALIANVDKSLSIVLLMQHQYQPRDISFELQIYRIIQEFLSNVIKHAKASNMLIHIRDTKGSLCIILSDDGVGFDHSQLQEGMGLENIDSRIKSIDGRCKWKSKKGKGVRLIIAQPTL
ncbi:sensor histidine kinase [Flammeovirga aprica]|uniref:histidine kinase n=1 Tax=Flammeovirga aprica JL-4 TaxID=694437 RepID=A0A7X9XCG0_9BACT|nr:ATP-binding protein [Flammeovirga aprica]NME71594.1 histidine kinase [Flammeovirga aprica JL-4]